MNPIHTNNGRVLGVLNLPKGAWYLKTMPDDTLVLACPITDEDGNNGTMYCNQDLPEGNWTILGRVKDITEEQAKEIVETKFDGYVNYYCPAEGYKDTALESFASFCTLHNLTPEMLILKEKI